MQGLGLLNLRNPPGSIAGHIMSLGVFARAARYQDKDFELIEFMEKYCETKEIDYPELLIRIEVFLQDIGHWIPDAITLIERLSAL